MTSLFPIFPVPFSSIQAFMTPAVTRAASLRGERQTGASDEIRVAFFNASSKGLKKKEQQVAAQSSGTPPESASVAEEVSHVSNSGPVEDLCYHSRHAPNAENGREIRKVADPCADTFALTARLEADHFSRLDHLSTRLEQLREGQRDMCIRAVEIESATGSTTSDLNALSHRVSGLEQKNAKNIPVGQSPS